MGKKLKLSIDDLKVTSFVTSVNGIRGGLYPTETCGCGGGTGEGDTDPIATEITCQTVENCITQGVMTNKCGTNTNTTYTAPTADTVCGGCHCN